MAVAVDAVHNADNDGLLPFTQLPSAGDTAEIMGLADEIAREFSSVIVIGIGGSDLGARAVHRALNHQFYNYDIGLRNRRPRLFFAGDTTDPVSLQEIMDLITWNETALLVISKSGETIEVMSSFLILRDRLITAVGEEQAKRQIIAITDPAGGTMREIVRREGYRNLPHGPVGGRFSVLSNVGLLPLAIAGIDIGAMRRGAHEVQQHPQAAQSWALRQYVGYVECHEHISVLMPYVYSLREVGLWFRQLWAESLGKNDHVGPTPVAALGPTDQHSQVQLYREGPKNKFITFIGVKDLPTNLNIPHAFDDLAPVQHVAGSNMKRILDAELHATAESLFENERYSGVITLDLLDAHHMGALLYFFELATAYTASMFRVNAYDQPGVQRGKELIHSLLSEH